MVMFREYKILRSTVSIVPLVCLVLLYEFRVVQLYRTFSTRRSKVYRVLQGALNRSINSCKES